MSSQKTGQVRFLNQVHFLEKRTCPVFRGGFWGRPVFWGPFSGQIPHMTEVRVSAPRCVEQRGLTPQATRWLPGICRMVQNWIFGRHVRNMRAEQDWDAALFVS